MVLVQLLYCIRVVCNTFPASVCKRIQSFPTWFLLSHQPSETKYCLGQFSSVFYFSLRWAPLCVELLLGYQFTGVVRCCIPIIYRIYFYIYSIYYCSVYSETCIIKPPTKVLKQMPEELCFQPIRKNSALAMKYMHGGLAHADCVWFRWCRCFVHCNIW